ncbi:hypothetical protein SAMN04488040_3005 [Sulfitobacter marinus]|uniref:Uncharacterized protein n=1 Tax=Sulfitobacter marinus TaxID=394264 RepID=A0A1I6V0Y8_9RHOB|nr:hypothetical protein [Sulfitobacter marinus]SFT07338.1 hypothetical protein SAMN04488040_3005 [Sulfitobacter marinus]
MIARIAGAGARGILVALLVTTPALMLPNSVHDADQITMLIALLASFLTFVEYNSKYPSIVEFRDAPPFNRLRFASLFAIVIVLTLILKHKVDPSEMSQALTSIGTILGNAMDFPFSPVRMIVLMLPENTSFARVESVRVSAGMAYLISLLSMAAFLVLVRVMNWPTRKGAFNVWVNMPLFDPTAGGDVIYRLRRDARINIVVGFLLPFVIPAVVKAASDLIDPITLQNPQTQIWTVAAWAFLPASMIIRGIALSKIADMIGEKRRRAYAADKKAGKDGDKKTMQPA